MFLSIQLTNSNVVNLLSILTLLKKVRGEFMGLEYTKGWLQRKS